MADYQTICRVADVPPGEARLLKVGERLLGVFHVGGEFFVLDNACPHAGASLAHGLLDEAAETVCCRIHHWRFSLRTGEYLDDNQARYRARTYPVRLCDGEVQVDLSDSEGD